MPAPEGIEYADYIKVNKIRFSQARRKNIQYLFMVQFLKINLKAQDKHWDVLKSVHLQYGSILQEA